MSDLSQTECRDCGWYEGDGPHAWPCEIAAEIERRRAELPTRIGLCPDHGQEFYYPLSDGEGLQCPVCTCRMTVYERKP